jgi:type VI secretion system FHA domain protein
LTVISDHRLQLRDRASIVFGVRGGSIGRAHDNSWVLPDPQLHLSGQHALIHFRQGAWYLEDTSTNGVYVNGAALPLGRGSPHALRDGDQIGIGDYRLQANIDTDVAEPTGKASALAGQPGAETLSQLAVERVVPLRPAPRNVNPDLGASLNIEALISPDGADALIEAAQEKLAARAEEKVQQRRERLRAATRARLEGQSPQSNDAQTGLQAFCRGAGIDPARLPPDAQSLHFAGQLLREALLGIRDVLLEQESFRHRDRIELPQEPVEGPSIDKMPIDEFLRALIEGHGRREVDGVVLLRAVFRRAGRHEAALGPALRTALTQFMAHLEPGLIDSRRRDTVRNSSWDLFTEIYRSLMQTQDDALPHLFLESLAQSYLKQLGQPTQDEWGGATLPRKPG